MGAQLVNLAHLVVTLKNLLVLEHMLVQILCEIHGCIVHGILQLVGELNI